MEQLCETVKQGGYDLGIAFDGDADRFLLVNELGEIVDGDAIMYMHAVDLKSKNLLTDNKIVLTVMSNIGLKKALTNENIGYLEVGVGDKYVQACLKEKHLVLGGEQSGHIIFFNDLNTGDGLLSAIKTLNLIGEKQQKLSEITAKLHIFPQFLRNIVVINKDVLMQKEALIDAIKEVEKELAGDGRILVRPSGTEQLIRVMVEAHTMELCKKYVNNVADVIVNLSYK
jgi:phosphoglucosamine mutase